MGDFLPLSYPLRLLKEAKTIIACDGAKKTLYEKGIHPDAIVGDLDSIPAGLRERYADRIHHVEDQEINDLTKSVRFAHTQGYREVLILGATGLREDHTLGNISLLMDYAHLFKRVEMLSDYGLFTPILETTTFASYPGQQISIFVLYPEGRLVRKDSVGPFADKAHLMVARNSQRGFGRPLHCHSLPGLPGNHLQGGIPYKE